ncbi:hypothetical protein PPL_02601 [Heterostelium album PN500]|uniref:Ankyrin repeat-containing protein n=1 Tax=Heterostelium pallidum (strain ATCC 26659 / Pp 5 / PN500) TaxID=670386 RepID=D3B2I8_HETP5|nr:hypothetical protein PPL_02601 [Heterostelium album PN500]EFA83536.1 hypothetical protein PPL_02601 [Heterostelium album PN500]|eukprot:XP_020435653.1 hypothetical protein PPL_02601 [Heterostelium album PN500]
MEQNSIDKSLRNVLFINKALSRYIFSKVEELSKISEIDKQYSLQCFKYHQWLDVSDMILKYPYLLLDKLKHPIYRDSIAFALKDARVLGTGVIESACVAGNLEIVKLLWSQVDHDPLPLEGALETAIEYGHIDIVLYLHRHAISLGLPDGQRCSFKCILNRMAYNPNFIASWFRLWNKDKSEGHSAMLELFGGDDCNSELDCVKTMIDQLAKPSICHILFLGCSLFYQLAASYNYQYVAPFDNLDQQYMRDLFKDRSFLQQTFEVKAEITTILIMLSEEQKVPKSSAEVNMKIKHLLLQTTDLHLDLHTSDNWELIYLFLRSLIVTSSDTGYLDRMIELEMSLPDIGHNQLRKIMKQAGHSRYLVYGYSDLVQLRIILDQSIDNPFIVDFSELLLHLVSKTNPNIIVAEYLLDQLLTINPEIVGHVLNSRVELHLESRDSFLFIFNRFNDLNSNLSLSVQTIMNIFNHHGLYEELVELCESIITKEGWFVMFEKVVFTSTVHDWRYHHIMSLLSSIAPTISYDEISNRIHQSITFTSNNFRHLKVLSDRNLRQNPIGVILNTEKMGAFGNVETYQLLKDLQSDLSIKIMVPSWEYNVFYYAHAHGNHKWIEYIGLEDSEFSCSTSQFRSYEEWLGESLIEIPPKKSRKFVKHLQNLFGSSNFDMKSNKQTTFELSNSSSFSQSPFFSQTTNSVQSVNSPYYNWGNNTSNRFR